eukprot:jgi/Botrbrau1/2801/Bobra.0125s0012.1
MWLGRWIVAAVLLVLLAVAAWAGTWAVTYKLAPRGRAQLASAVAGQHSKFTLLATSYDARAPNLRWWVYHYSQCPSVGEIFLVWNRGPPPNVSEFHSPVPVRIRQEAHNLLTNRFQPDPNITYRAVLSLDDDIYIPCKDIERGFSMWRRHPERLVGYVPRLMDSSPPEYRGESYVRKRGIYNMILGGAAFIDSWTYFPVFGSPDLAPMREVVDRLFNCEDILLNFIAANATGTRQSIQYVPLLLRIHAWQLSGVGLSKDFFEHYRRRTECLKEFVKLYGRNPLKRVEYPRQNWLLTLLGGSLGPPCSAARASHHHHFRHHRKLRG